MKLLNNGNVINDLYTVNINDKQIKHKVKIKYLKIFKLAIKG